MSLHPSIVDIIHRGGRKGGMGLVFDPGYWLGMPADSVYLDGEKLFRLWQEVYLLEKCEELPSGSAENLVHFINDLKLLRPAHFMHGLQLWAGQDYKRLPPVMFSLIQPRGTHDQMFLGSLAGSMGYAGREDHHSDRARREFNILRNKALNS